MSVSDSAKQFAVNWNNHMNHVKKAFDHLLNSSEFTDVTLYVEGRRVGAHKILLSACSLYFREIFREFPQDHPIVVLKGISYSTLTDILKFIYNGEVSVDTEDFNSFLQTAEFLQISGLTETDKTEQKTEASSKQNNEVVNNSKADGVNKDTEQISENSGLQNRKCKREIEVEQNILMKRLKESEAMEFTAIKCEPSEFERIFDESTEDPLQQDSSEYSQELFEGTNSLVSTDEIMIVDIEKKLPFTCQICGRGYHLKDSLYKHLSVHAGNTTCTICSKVLSRKTHLERHMVMTHGVDIHSVRNNYNVVIQPNESVQPKNADSKSN